MTHSQQRDEQNTWAGCLLLLATVLVAFPAGVWISMWTAPLLLGLLGANSADVLKLAVGVVLCTPTVFTGLAFYFGGRALLRILGVRLTKPRQPCPDETRATELELGSYVLSQQPDRLIVHESSAERALGLIMNPLCGALFVGLFVALVRDPGGFGRGLLNEIGVIRFNAQGWPLAILGWTVSVAALVFFGVMAALCFRGFYRKLRFGRRHWIFDRSSDAFSYRTRIIRSLSSIEQTVLSEDRYYYVAFAPELPHTASELAFRGLREDLFVFSAQQDAEKFAAIVACFLRVDVRRGLARGSERRPST
jgi:hypothetical protein